MIIDRVEIPLAAGTEAEFIAAMRQRGLALLRGAAGCSGAEIGRGVENPGRALLLLTWDSVESHVAYTKTTSFDEFKALVGPYFGGAPAMEHFDMG